MQHSVWTGQIGYGMLAIPVKLCAAARRESVEFHLVYGIDPPAGAKGANGSAGTAPSNVLRFPGSEGSTEPPIPDHVARVHRAWVGEDRCTLIPDSALYRAWEYEVEKYAVFRKSELDALSAPKSDELQIIECVDPCEIDPKYYAESYDIWPDTGGKKGYEVLYYALRDSKSVAIGELPMSGRERLVMIRPGGRGLVLHKLFFPQEVDFDDEYKVQGGLSSALERELAGTLARSLKNRWEPGKYTDKYLERIIEFVSNRCRSAYPVNGKGKTPRPAGVVNIEDALRRSVELTRKPPDSDRGGSGPRKKGKRPGA